MPDHTWLPLGTRKGHQLDWCTACGAVRLEQPGETVSGYLYLSPAASRTVDQGDGEPVWSPSDHLGCLPTQKRELQGPTVPFEEVLRRAGVDLEEPEG